MNLKNSGNSTGFEPMTSAMPVQCSNQLSYEVTQLRAGCWANKLTQNKLTQNKSTRVLDLPIKLLAWWQSTVEFTSKSSFKEPINQSQQLW